MIHLQRAQGLQGLKSSCNPTSQDFRGEAITFLAKPDNWRIKFAVWTFSSFPNSLSFSLLAQTAITGKNFCVLKVFLLFSLLPAYHAHGEIEIYELSIKCWLPKSHQRHLERGSESISSNKLQKKCCKYWNIHDSPPWSKIFLPPSFRYAREWGRECASCKTRNRRGGTEIRRKRRRRRSHMISHTWGLTPSSRRNRMSWDSKHLTTYSDCQIILLHESIDTHDVNKLFE